MLDGRIPEVVPDARGEDATRELRVTSEADIGSYCAVALVFSDGQPYGTLCCVSRTPDPSPSISVTRTVISCYSPVVQYNIGCDQVPRTQTTGASCLSEGTN